jgi:hypothetical protein
VAYLLNPLSVGNDEIPFIPPAMVIERLHTFFEKQGLDKLEIMKTLWQLRRQEGQFYRGSFLWDYTQDMKTFWETTRGISPVLAPLAIRLASTSSNSVPSERSFSILKLLQNKLRSRLDYDRVDQLQYIYINERVLAKVLPGNRPSEENEESLIELEDDLIAGGETHENNPALIWQYIEE